MYNWTMGYITHYKSFIYVNKYLIYNYCPDFNNISYRYMFRDSKISRQQKMMHQLTCPFIIAYPKALPMDLVIEGKREIYKVQFSVFTTSKDQTILLYPKSGKPLIEMPSKDVWFNAFNKQDRSFAEAIPLTLGGHLVGINILRFADYSEWDA